MARPRQVALSRLQERRISTIPNSKAEHLLADAVGIAGHLAASTAHTRHWSGELNCYRCVAKLLLKFIKWRDLNHSHNFIPPLHLRLSNHLPPTTPTIEACDAVYMLVQACLERSELSWTGSDRAMNQRPQESLLAVCKALMVRR